MNELLAGRTSTGDGRFWLVTVARYRHDTRRQQAASRYADWFKCGLAPLRAVGGKVVLRLVDEDVRSVWWSSAAHCDDGAVNAAGRREFGYDAVTVVELPSPAAFQEMRAKYDYVRRCACPAAASSMFAARVGEAVVVAARNTARNIECTTSNLLHVGVVGEHATTTTTSLLPFDFFESMQGGALSLRLVLPRDMKDDSDHGYAEISDGAQYGALLSRRQMHRGRL